MLPTGVSPSEFSINLHYREQKYTVNALGNGATQRRITPAYFRVHETQSAVRAGGSDQTLILLWEIRHILQSAQTEQHTRQQAPSALPAN